MPQESHRISQRSPISTRIFYHTRRTLARKLAPNEKISKIVTPGDLAIGTGKDAPSGRDLAQKEHLSALGPRSAACGSHKSWRGGSSLGSKFAHVSLEIDPLGISGICSHHGENYIARETFLQPPGIIRALPTRSRSRPLRPGARDPSRRASSHPSDRASTRTCSSAPPRPSDRRPGGRGRSTFGPRGPRRRSCTTPTGPNRRTTHAAG